MFPFHLFSLIWFIIYWGVLIYVFYSIRHLILIKRKKNDLENKLSLLREKFERGEILIDEYKNKKKEIEKNFKI